MATQYEQCDVWANSMHCTIYAESRIAQQLGARDAMFHAGSVQLKHAVPAMLVHVCVTAFARASNCTTLAIQGLSWLTLHNWVHVQVLSRIHAQALHVTVVRSVRMQMLSCIHAQALHFKVVKTVPVISATVTPFSAAAGRSTWSEPIPAVKASLSFFAFESLSALM